jgi:hypothetical protein
VLAELAGTTSSTSTDNTSSSTTGIDEGALHSTSTTDIMPQLA